MYLSQTSNDCDQLLNQLDSEHLNHKYMQNINYVCEWKGIKYFHPIILGKISFYGVAFLGDISLYATALKVIPSIFNSKPEILYNHFVGSEKLEVAKELRHLEGIKYLCQNDLAKFYASNFSAIADRFLFAIESKDIESFGKLFNTNSKPIYENAPLYLSFAYKHNSLDIATFLLNKQITFNIVDLTRINLNLSKDKYITHFSELRESQLIDDSQLHELEILIDAMFNRDKLTYHSATRNIGTLIHSSGVCKIIQNIVTNIPLNEITRCLFGMLLAVHSPHILSPSKGTIMPFFSDANSYYKLYVPNPLDKHFLIHLIHELTHALEYILFKNPYPYPNVGYGSKNEYYVAYQNARDEFLKNILKELKLGFVSGQPKEYSLAESEVLHVHQYCTSTRASPQLFHIIASKYSFGHWDIATLFSELRLEDINQLMQNINETTPSLLEILYVDLQSKDEKDFSKKITSVFALDEKQTQSKLNLYSVFKKDLNQALHKFCLDQHWTDAYSQLLSRIFDYVKRDEAEWDSELLPRFAEIFIENKSDPKIMDLYKPLSKYWKNYIVPEAEKVMHKYYITPLKIFMKEEDTLVARILKHLGFWQDEPQLRNILAREEEFNKLYPEYNLTDELLSIRNDFLEQSC